MKNFVLFVLLSMAGAVGAHADDDMAVSALVKCEQGATASEASAKLNADFFVDSVSVKAKSSIGDLPLKIVKPYNVSQPAITSLASAIEVCVTLTK